MKCPECNARSDVLETRERKYHVTRRHLCPLCKCKFTTKEIIFHTKPKSPGATAEQMRQMRMAVGARGEQ